MQIYCKASLTAGGASHPSRTFAESLEVMISPSRIDDDSCNFYEHQIYEFATNISPESRSPPRLFPRTPPGQAMAVSSGSCRGRVLWRPHMPRPMLSMPSHAIHVHTHTLMVLQQISQHSQHQSTARVRVPSAPFGLAEQGLLFEHSFLFQNFQAGWERLQSIRF